MHSTLPLFNWLFFELWVYSGSCKNTIFFAIFWGYLKHQKAYFWYDPSTRHRRFYDPLVQVLLNHTRSFLGSYFNARNAFYSLVGPQHLICISWFVWKWGYPPFLWITVSSCSLLISIIGDIPEFQTVLYVLKQCWSIQWPDPVVPCCTYINGSGSTPARTTSGVEAPAQRSHCHQILRVAWCDGFHACIDDSPTIGVRSPWLHWLQKRNSHSILLFCLMSSLDISWNMPPLSPRL